MSEGRWNEEGYWEWGSNLEGRDKGKPDPILEAWEGLSTFLAAGGVGDDEEGAHVMEDVLSALADNGRWYSWGVITRGLAGENAGVLRRLTDRHWNQAHGTSEFFTAVQESGIDVDDSALVAAMREVDAARRAHIESAF
jgi:hypothetical protein